MLFDAATFEAQISLRLIPTEQLPSVAQDALEAEFEGPRVVRMAVMGPTEVWAIDQALPLMLTELGCRAISPADAALRLAQQHAKRLLETGDDPLPSLPYFSRLMSAGDHPRQLMELGYLEDAFDFFSQPDIEKKRSCMREALEELLSKQPH